MVIYCTDLEERAAAEMAWRLACKDPPPDITDAVNPNMPVLFAVCGVDSTAENYRMQSFIREWAAMGYAPAQSLLAKVTAKRLGV